MRYYEEKNILLFLQKHTFSHNDLYANSDSFVFTGERVILLRYVHRRSSELSCSRDCKLK